MKVGQAVRDTTILRDNCPTIPCVAFIWPISFTFFSPFDGQSSYKSAIESGKIFNCIIFYNASEIYVHFPRFPDTFEILVKFKMAAILEAILDDITGSSTMPLPIILTFTL